MTVNIQTTSGDMIHNATFPSNEKSQAETVLAVIPLEDCKLREEPSLSGTENISQVAHPRYQASTAQVEDQKSKLDDSAMLSGIEALADNSTVVVRQHSDQPSHQPVESTVQNPNLAASSFKEHIHINAEQAQTEPTARKVSTMIPLGAPKGDGDVRDQYKQMLMAKFDRKMIERRRTDRSREP